MRTRTFKKLLTIIALLLIAVAAAVVILGLTVPIDNHAIQEQSMTKPIPHTITPNTTRVPDLALLLKLAHKNLRQQLFDPPPQPVIKKYVRPVPTVRLLGTIVNTRNSQAMILGSNGKVELKRVGDIVGEVDNAAVIDMIYTDRITIEHAGETYEIAIVTVNRSSR